MRFGSVPLDAAEGAILAHSETVQGGRLRKGQVLGPAEISALQLAGRTEVVVARMDPGDLDENTAAFRLAAALVPDPAKQGLRLSKAFTGRVNLNAAEVGVIELDVECIHALNRVDPAITFATLPPFARVEPGMLAGTVKIITYAVSAAAVEEACALGLAALRLRPVVLQTAGLVLTEVPGQDPKLTEKGRKVIAARLAALGIELAGVAVVDHAPDAIAAALPTLPGQMALILTGSATSDLFDTAPEGLRAAGGLVIRFGMPVDPGNLLFLGDLFGKPVIGLPGCARSPALNGADWVLERIACGIRVTGLDIAAMGVGGLLKEIPIRPQLREPGPVHKPGDQKSAF